MDKARIFISYAREDESAVRQLYRKLSDVGFIPWLDRVDLLPGEQWRPSIEKALREADFLIICLSNTSVQKRGFVQREFKAALDLWQEKHKDDIFIIPVRLEHCDPPDELGRFQWLDLFEDDAWPRLIRALREGMRRRGKALEVKPIIESAPLRNTFEKTIPTSIADTPPVDDKSPGAPSSPAGHPRPEPQKVPSDDPSKVVKLIEASGTQQPQKSRYAGAVPKSKEPMTWSFARVAALTPPIVKWAGLGLTLSAIALLTWLQWNSGNSTNSKSDGQSHPSSSLAVSSVVLPARGEAMRYWLELKNNAGRRVSGLEPLPAGERFQLHFTPSSGGYLYLVAPNEEQVLTTFVTKRRIEAGADFQFPGDDNWINVGEGERFTIIFSPELRDELSFLNGDGRQLTQEGEKKLRDFRDRFASTSPETKASSNSAIVTAQKRGDEPLVFEINITHRR